MPPPPDQDAEELLVPVSALQHYLFCPRQCALIHIERVWAEDGATMEGRLLHERVDHGKPDRRAGVRTVRGLVLRSFAHGLSGKADAVEFPGGVPYPVEYKRGRAKAHRADEVQLCAQALCLEEMFGCPVPEGALFYGQTRKRTRIAIDDDLRALTARIVAECRAMIVDARTPSPVAMPACRQCSLAQTCRPDKLQKPPTIASWLQRQLAD